MVHLKQHVPSQGTCETVKLRDLPFTFTLDYWLRGLTAAPAEGGALGPHKGHGDAVLRACQEGPQAAALVRVVHLRDAVQVEGPHQLPTLQQQRTASSFDRVLRLIQAGG